MSGYALSLVRAVLFVSAGHRFLPDIGGFTVLSTKALSTLLTMEWIKVFTEWITYPIIAVSSVHHFRPFSLPYTPHFLDPPWNRNRSNKVLKSCSDEVRQQGNRLSRNYSKPAKRQLDRGTRTIRIFQSVRHPGFRHSLWRLQRSQFPPARHILLWVCCDFRRGVSDCSVF